VLLQSLTIACPGIMALPLNAIAVMLCVAAAATCFATFKYAFSSCSIAVASMRSCCAMNDPAVSSIHGRLAHLLMVVAHANVAAAAAAYACCCCCVLPGLPKLPYRAPRPIKSSKPALHSTKTHTCSNAMVMTADRVPSFFKAEELVDSAIKFADFSHPGE